MRVGLGFGGGGLGELGSWMDDKMNREMKDGLDG